MQTIIPIPDAPPSSRAGSQVVDDAKAAPSAVRNAIDTTGNASLAMTPVACIGRNTSAGRSLLLMTTSGDRTRAKMRLTAVEGVVSPVAFFCLCGPSPVLLLEGLLFA